jgi:hypothetical protein
VTAAEQYQTALDTTRHAATAANTSYDHAREVARIWREANGTVYDTTDDNPLWQALDKLAESFPEPNQETA